MFMRCTGSAQGSKPTNGRWSSHEHTLFLEALNLYGREWKKVANYIQTRSSAQIRSHAQKYFAKLEKEEESGIHGGAAAIHGDHVVLVDATSPGSKTRKKRKRRRQQQPKGGFTAKKVKSKKKKEKVTKKKNKTSKVNGTHDLLRLRVGPMSDNDNYTVDQMDHNQSRPNYFHAISHERSASPALLNRQYLSRNDSSPKTARVRVQGSTPDSFSLNSSSSYSSSSSMFAPQLDANMSQMSILLKKREQIAKELKNKMIITESTKNYIFFIDKSIEMLYNNVCQVSSGGGRASPTLGVKSGSITQCTCRRLCHIVHCRGSDNNNGNKVIRDINTSNVVKTATRVEATISTTSPTSSIIPTTSTTIDTGSLPTTTSSDCGCITTRRNILFLLQSSFRSYPLHISKQFELKMLQKWTMLNNEFLQIESKDSSITMYETAQIYHCMSKESQTKLQDLNETELTAVQVLVGTKMGLKPRKSPLRVDRQPQQQICS